MSRAWEGHGLADFDTWWVTEARRGLVYRGDVDMEFMGPGGRVTVLEFKQAGESLKGGQLAWLRHRARERRTEVRVVREVPGTDPLDPDRDVRVWDVTAPHDHVVPLQTFRLWCEDRAYRPGTGLGGPAAGARGGRMGA